VCVLSDLPRYQRDAVDRRNPEADLHAGPVWLVCWKPPPTAGRGACRCSTRPRPRQRPASTKPDAPVAGLVASAILHICTGAPRWVSKSGRSSSFGGPAVTSCRLLRGCTARACSS
jgi:hypothetical protein